MSQRPTLNSRLRVVVAKAYRTEKLYSSHGGRFEKLAGAAALSDAASEVRGREWQRAYQHLRCCLNDLLSLGNSAVVARDVLALREAYLAKADESNQLVKYGVEEMKEFADRQEFAHILRLSTELIRRKAQVQVCRAIAQELTEILDAQGSSKSIKAEQDRTQQFKSLLEGNGGEILFEHRSPTGYIGQLAEVGSFSAQMKNVVSFKSSRTSRLGR
jgi:hypothetical protein